MKRLLRSLTWVGLSERDPALENLKLLEFQRFTNLTSTEEAVLNAVNGYYVQTAESPSLASVVKLFEEQNKAEELQFLEEASKESFSAGADFSQLFEHEVGQQAANKFLTVCREAMKIATQGITVKGKLIKGADAAVSYIFSTATGAPRKEGDRVPVSMKAASGFLDNLYEERKKNPHKTYGVMTGYGLIDAATAGVRKKQLYIHAGYARQLKSTTMLNMMINAAVDGGWNPLLFTSEMPAEEVMLLMVAIHSANKKFAGVGRPLNSFRLLLGGIGSAEEKFFKEVKDDLVNNTRHGTIRVIDSGEFTHFSDVMQRCTREHQKEEVDLMWMDYITRLPIDPVKYRGMEVRTAKNEIIAEAKRFAMSFNDGEGLAVCTPFQVNREGFKRAVDHEGKMDLMALADYNAAEKEADIITYVFYGETEYKTNEPKIGMLKSRWGDTKPDPVSVFLDPDSRRMSDLSGGMSAIPTTGLTSTQVEL